MIEIMNMFVQGATWIILLVTLVFAVGIVWRVEAELDTAYMYFTFAVILTILHEFFLAWPLVREAWFGDLLIALTRFFGALMLLLGMYFMRDLIRRMDGEKSPRRGR